MSNQNTPLHSIYTSMTCPCEQCQQARNAPTALLPHLDKPASTPVVIVEIFTAIDAETGAKITYRWPIRRDHFIYR